MTDFIEKDGKPYTVSQGSWNGGIGELAQGPDARKPRVNVRFRMEPGMRFTDCGHIWEAGEDGWTPAFEVRRDELAQIVAGRLEPSEQAVRDARKRRDDDIEARIAECEEDLNRGLSPGEEPRRVLPRNWRGLLKYPDYAGRVQPLAVHYRAILGFALDKGEHSPRAVYQVEEIGPAPSLHDQYLMWRKEMSGTVPPPGAYDALDELKAVVAQQAARIEALTAALEAKPPKGK